MKQTSRGRRVIAFCERYCRAPEGEHVGKLITLEMFQRKFILAIYDAPRAIRRAYLSIARKNGKTALIAMILLAHLVGPEARQNSQIVSGARSRDQAALVFNLAAKMVMLSDELRPLVKIIPSGKRLIGLPMNVEYRALAADGQTAHGLSPVLAILDEVGQVRGPRDDFIDAITTSQGAHANPLMIAISTQAATDADLFSLWLDDAEKTDDGRTVCHLYTAPADAGLGDEETWKAANPALGKFLSLDDMRDQAERAARMPSAENTFRNLRLNQRVSTVTPFISKGVWESCAEAPDDDATEWLGGLDLSGRTDLTSFVLTATVGRIVSVFPYFWTPEDGLLERAKRDRVPYDLWVKEGFLRTTPGATVDFTFVASEIAEIIGDKNVRAIAFDRWRMIYFRKELDALGLDLPLQEFGQGFRDMSPAIETLENDLLNRNLRHGGHPILKMCAANAVVVRDPAGNRKLDKHKATGRIDGLVALAMARGLAGKEEESIDLGAFLSNPIII